MRLQIGKARANLDQFATTGPEVGYCQLGARPVLRTGVPARAPKYGNMGRDEDYPRTSGRALQKGEVGCRPTRDHIGPLVSEALVEKLMSQGLEEKPWIASFGKLKGLRKESARIDQIINREFDRIVPEDGQ